MRPIQAEKLDIENACDLVAAPCPSAHRAGCISLFNRSPSYALLAQAGPGSPSPKEVTPEKEGDKPWNGKGDAVSKTLKYAAFAGQVALTCSVALLTQASKNGEEHYSYNTLTVPFYSEVIKMVLSGSLLAKQCRHEPTGKAFKFKWVNFLSASVPALLYLISNNFNFIIIHEIGPLSFQILNNFKIVTAAIIFQIVMNRQLTAIQWRGIVLLTIGSLISQLQDCGDGGLMLTGTALGYGLKALNCTLTSFAGVYCEKFLKQTTDSIHYQNLQLYFWGTLFASLTLFFSSMQTGTGVEELWRGQNLHSVLLMLNYAFVGLATAFVLKYLDNIAKNFAAVTAMFAAAFAAHALFGEELSMHLMIGLLVAAMAADLYMKHNQL